jgi:hypothetical protein
MSRAALRPEEPCKHCGQRHGRAIPCTQDALLLRRFAAAWRQDASAVDRSEAVAMARYARRMP